MAERQRAYTASPISVTGMPSSSELMPVHLPVPFLPGGVEDLVDDRSAVFVFLGEDVARDLDEVAVQLALVPLGEDVVQSRRRTGPSPSFSSWYASQMSCMSPYSMPLWTILT